ncbi:hypothetical protein PG994_007340 [Apiospora phragmitis]|uniref:Uncharacterized protein n=1 Tax=Apiospora phragmitis TaxID=2905665 RepID=A0ABR1V1A2_9PEZI
MADSWIGFAFGKKCAPDSGDDNLHRGGTPSTPHDASAWDDYAVDEQSRAPSEETPPTSQEASAWNEYAAVERPKTFDLQRAPLRSVV